MKMRGLLWVLALLLGIGSVYAQDLRRYNMFITFPKGGSLSGVCLIRMSGADGVMSVMNEFGIKAFDAVYTAKKDKVKLRNVVGMLDKWYIRKVIAKDMSYLFNPKKKISKRRAMEHEADGSILLTNKRFKITYRLQPICLNDE